jgi:hypothetical protein
MMKTTTIREEIIVPRAIEREWRRSIRKGMAFLDNYFGRKGWVLDIDLEKLDLHNATTCVAGQLFETHAEQRAENIWADAGYDWAIKYVVEHEPWAIERGLTVHGTGESVVAKELGFYIPTSEYDDDDLYEGDDPIESRIARRNGVDIHYLWKNDCNHWQLFTREWERAIKKRIDQLA